ncbi:hypothetical protein BJ166DRAFT_494388 [Pestalotiopsis sp. NC0098]|nr:hypothetical protein BJ166DRAFT_494388 [Pestalotiopsis sp. NC0098]
MAYSRRQIVAYPPAFCTYLETTHQACSSCLVRNSSLVDLNNPGLPAWLVINLCSISAAHLGTSPLFLHLPGDRTHHSILFLHTNCLDEDRTTTHHLDSYVQQNAVQHLFNTFHCLCCLLVGTKPVTAMADEIQPPQQPSAGPQSTQTQPPQRLSAGWQPIQNHPKVDDQALKELLRSFERKVQGHQIHRGETLGRVYELREELGHLRQIHGFAARFDGTVRILIRAGEKLKDMDRICRPLILNHQFALWDGMEQVLQGFHQRLMDALRVVDKDIDRATDHYKKVCRVSGTIKSELSRACLSENCGAPHIIEVVDALKRRCYDLFIELFVNLRRSRRSVADMKARADEMLEKAAQRHEEVKQMLAPIAAWAYHPATDRIRRYRSASCPP